MSQEFKDRLLEVDPALEDYAYAPANYAAAIIAALAGEAAGTAAATAVAAENSRVARDGGDRAEDR